VRGVLEIIRPINKDEARVGEALRLALLLGAVVSGVLFGGTMLVVRIVHKPNHIFEYNEPSKNFPNGSEI
jgi:hypothetical protein